MAKHTCPNCQHTFETTASKKPPVKGALVFSHMRANGTKANFSRGMSLIIRARQRGDISAGIDWLPEYMANAPWNRFCADYAQAWSMNDAAAS